MSKLCLSHLAIKTVYKQKLHHIFRERKKKSKNITIYRMEVTMLYGAIIPKYKNRENVKL